jgi:hypothetical protein
MRRRPQAPSRPKNFIFHYDESCALETIFPPPIFKCGLTTLQLDIVVCRDNLLLDPLLLAGSELMVEQPAIGRLAVVAGTFGDELPRSATAAQFVIVPLAFFGAGDDDRQRAVGPEVSLVEVEAQRLIPLEK